MKSTSFDPKARTGNLFNKERPIANGCIDTATMLMQCYATTDASTLLFSPEATSILRLTDISIS